MIITKLFISWSGEFSRKVAERLSIWIQIIIQTVDVFYSSDDIEKGENWSNRLSAELEQSNFGVICLTPENILAPWIHFEAGALSKITDSRVSAIMLGISPSDIKGPLARFQNTAFNRKDFYRLFQSINSAQDTPLKQTVLERAFNNSWENLERDLTTIINEYFSCTASSAVIESKSDEHDKNNDIFQEILSIVRALDNNLKQIQQNYFESPSNPAVPVMPSVTPVARQEELKKVQIYYPIHDNFPAEVINIIDNYDNTPPRLRLLYRVDLQKGFIYATVNVWKIPLLRKELAEFDAILAE